MRDTNNPILIDKASEIYNDKGSLVQFRYSQGDPGALEEEKLPYRLSKTNQFDMTDKLSGEQNRMVYAQVRPSYFENKSQTPLFDCPTKRIMNSAGNDITMQKTADLVRLDSQKSNADNSTTNKVKQDEWETTLRNLHGLIPLKKSKTFDEQVPKSSLLAAAVPASKKYADELYSYIDPVKFRNLRKTFEHYASLGDLTNFKTMDSIQFQALLKTNKLYFKGFAAKDADIVFYKDNTKRFVTFDEFCRIMIELAKLKYQGKADIPTGEKVRLYLKEFVFIREKDAYKHKTDSSEDWLLELETDKLKQLLRSWKPVFKSEFLKFASKSLANNEPVMDSKIMHKYCREREINPNLLNRATCFKLFKECQRSDKADIHKEFLTFLEFMEFISFVGIQYFTDNEKHYPKLDTIEKKVDAMFKWLQNKIK
uniref:Uncharacterized protein n=1 Tax=Euplotes harpa TaxID=151035 RepID=A0A7S3JD64_9SPIT|mmetsp:Transcript_3388/g.4169  ORF Transcript_3388/g.4169 Transcript_3388/m.4169 type:complete len:425 (+) Transcript_3388:2-1276(+)